MEDDNNPYSSPSFQPEIRPIPPIRRKRSGLNGFDKFCAVIAFLLAVALMILGVFGLVFGCRAHFSLPPILGVIPAFAAWGIIRPIMVAWNLPQTNSVDPA